MFARLSRFARSWLPFWILDVLYAIACSVVLGFLLGFGLVLILVAICPYQEKLIDKTATPQEYLEIRRWALPKIQCCYRYVRVPCTVVIFVRRCVK